MNLSKSTFLFLLSFIFLSEVSYSQQPNDLIILGLDKDNGWHYFNTKGDVLLKSVDEIYYFSDGLLMREEKRKWGFIDCRGTWVVPPQFNEVRLYSEGYAPVRKLLYWYFIDKTGKLIGEEKYEDVKEFSNGLAGVKQDGKWGFIDTTGNYVISPQYLRVKAFANGVAAVEESKHNWHFINKEGKTVATTIEEYDNVGDYNSEIILARKGTIFLDEVVKSGYIDSEGRKVILFKFDDASDFSNGYAKVQENLLWGYIRTDGTYFVKPQFKGAADFKDGLARVNVEGKWGVIDAKGFLVCEPKFHYLGEFFSGIAAAEGKRGEWGLVNTKGEWILKPNYKYIKRVMPSACR